MKNIVIFGAPGCGKGTQSARIIDRFGLTHISTGELLRKEIADGTELGRVADSYISKGHLIPDHLMCEILAARIDSLLPTSKGFIFDGFPRTIAQAEELKKMLDARGQHIEAVVGLEVPDDELMVRLVERGKVSGRADDNPETIARRLQVYHNTTKPLRDYYVAEGIYRPINGSGSIDEIFENISNAIA